MKTKMLLLSLGLLSASSAFAGDVTLSAGLAETRTDGVKFRGGNIKVGFQPAGTGFGFLTSLTNTGFKNERKSEYDGGLPSIIVSQKVSYFSAQAGISYALANWVQPYIMAGWAGMDIESKLKIGQVELRRSDKFDGLVYGGGIAFSPVKSMLIDLSYERSDLNGHSTNTWMVGTGWRF